ncbi:unnamed protein product [Sphagnum troendelagicum]|jgi:hypothetical protein
MGKHLREGAAKQRGTPNSRFAIGKKLSNKHLQRDSDNETGERREQQCERVDGYKVLAGHSEQMLQWIYIQGPSVILANDLTDKTKLLGTQIMQENLNKVSLH